MDWKLKRINVRLKEGEEKYMHLVLERERRSAIHGAVKPPESRPAKNALVKTSKKRKSSKCDLIPVTLVCTSECWQFISDADLKVHY